MDDDLELVRRAKKGEHDAFNGIIEKYYRSVLNLVYRFYGCEPHEAEDIAQEVFLRIFRSIGKFEGRSSFFTYLYKVTMNLCFKKRKSSKAVASLDELQDHGAGLCDSRSSVESDYQKEELGKMVHEAISSLPEEQRAVVVLNRFQGLSYEEIAQVLNLSLPAVKSRLHRAKIALKEKLAPLLGEG